MSDELLKNFPELEADGAPVHPGELLKYDILPSIKQTQAEVAEILGMSRTNLNRIMSGSVAVSAGTALRLAMLFGNDPMYWLGLQGQCDIWREAELMDEEERIRIRNGAEGIAQQRAEAPLASEAVQVSLPVNELVDLETFTNIVDYWIEEGTRSFVVVNLTLANENVPDNDIRASTLKLAEFLNEFAHEFSLTDDQESVSIAIKEIGSAAVTHLSRMWSDNLLERPLIAGFVEYPSYTANAIQLVKAAAYTRTLPFNSWLLTAPVLTGPLHGHLEPIDEIRLADPRRYALPFQYLKAVLQHRISTAPLSDDESIAVSLGLRISDALYENPTKTSPMRGFIAPPDLTPLDPAVVFYALLYGVIDVLEKQTGAGELARQLHMVWTSLSKNADSIDIEQIARYQVSQFDTYYSKYMSSIGLPLRNDSHYEWSTKSVVREHFYRNS